VTSGSFEDVYSENFGDVHRFVVRLGVAPGEAEDITQRVFVIAYKKMENGERIEKHLAWLRAIAHRVVQQHRRWRRVRKMHAHLLPSSLGLRDNQPDDADVTLIRSSRSAQLRAAIAELNDKLRDAIVLTDMEGMQYSAAAEVLKIPVNTLRSRRRLAISALRSKLSKQTNPDSSTHRCLEIEA